MMAETAYCSESTYLPCVPKYSALLRRLTGILKLDEKAGK